jgi:hypothetical protein
MERRTQTSLLLSVSTFVLAAGCGLDAQRTASSNQSLSSGWQLEMATPPEILGFSALGDSADYDALHYLQSQELRADFDQDGKMDVISFGKSNADRTYNDEITVTYGDPDKQPYTYVLSNNDECSSPYYAETVYLGNQSTWPSIVIAAIRPVGAGSGTVPSGCNLSWFQRTGQVVLVNDAGAWKPQYLSTFSIMGRTVKCTKLPFYSATKAECMWASYGSDENDSPTNWTTLAEIDYENGSFTWTDVTEAKGLPWNGVAGKNMQTSEGRFMVGFTWTDLNNDGLPDLAASGQHSYDFQAIMEKIDGGTNYSFTNVGWFDGTQEGVGASGPGVLSGMNYPCAYFGVEPYQQEQGEIHNDDYVDCYEGGSWSYLALPSTDYNGAAIDHYFNGEGDVRLRINYYAVSGDTSDLYFATEAFPHHDQLDGLDVIIRAVPAGDNRPPVPYNMTAVPHYDVNTKVSYVSIGWYSSGGDTSGFYYTLAEGATIPNCSTSSPWSDANIKSDGNHYWVDVANDGTSLIPGKLYTTGLCAFDESANTFSPISAARFYASYPTMVFSPGSLTMTQGQYVGNGTEYFTMQTDGNLVLYNQDSQWIWTSDTYHECTECEAIYQTDGNLVVYDTSQNPWKSLFSVGYGSTEMTLSVASPYVIFTN